MFHCIYRLWVVGQRNLPTRVADLLLASSLLFGVIKTFFPIIFQLKQINYRRSFTLLVVDKYLLVFSYLSAKHFNFLWIVCCTLFYKNVQPEICQNIKGPIVYYVPEGGGVFQNSVVYQNVTPQIITYA